MTQRLDDLRMVDPVLTTIAKGYSNSAFIAEKLFPEVIVPKMKGKIPVFGREAFIVRDTFRSIRADSNRIAPSEFQLASFETKERDVEIALDYLEEEESLDFARYEQKLAKDLREILLLGKEKEAADLVQDPANYETWQKLDLPAISAFNDYASDTDPIAIIRECMSGLRERIARFPNVMVMGDSVYQALVQHPKIIERIKHAGIGKANKELLAQLCDIDAVYVGEAVYSADGSTFSDIWSGNVILAYVDKNDNSKRSEFNPSFGYTFRRDAMPEVDFYYENGGKLKVIRATDNYAQKAVASDAAFLIYNALSQGVQ